MKLEGSNVFITGGAGGIGEACAWKLAQSGAKVCLADVDSTRGLKLVEDINNSLEKERVFFFMCDVSQKDSFKDAFENALKIVKNIDVMVNNAGIHDETSWEKMLGVNLNGTIIGTNLAYEHMRSDKGGQGGAIITVSSILGIEDRPIVPIYSATKTASVGLMRAMAALPNRHGVRFACICPDSVDTPLLNLEAHQVGEGWFPFVQRLKTIPKLSPDTVADGLMLLIEDNKSNGAIQKISLEEGIVRVKLGYEKVSS